MFKGILLALFLLPTAAFSLDLRLGLMQPDSPLYENRYDEYIDDDGIVGRIEIAQRFRFTPVVSINIFATHLSLFNERDPHYGFNAIGAEIEFKFDLFK